MGYVALLVGIMVLLHSSSGWPESAVRRWSPAPAVGVLITTSWLLPLAIFFSLHAGSEDARRRLDVQFVGYRLPLTALRDCAGLVAAAIAPGFTIGGGGRGRTQGAPDALVVLAGIGL